MRLETESNGEADKKERGRKGSSWRHSEQAGDRGQVVFVTVPGSKPKACQCTEFSEASSSSHKHRAPTTQHSDSCARSWHFVTKSFLSQQGPWERVMSAPPPWIPMFG